MKHADKAQKEGSVGEYKFRKLRERGDDNEKERRVEKEKGI